MCGGFFASRKWARTIQTVDLKWLVVIWRFFSSFVPVAGRLNGPNQVVYDSEEAMLDESWNNRLNQSRGVFPHKNGLYQVNMLNAAPNSTKNKSSLRVHRYILLLWPPHVVFLESSIICVLLSFMYEVWCTDHTPQQTVELTSVTIPVGSVYSFVRIFCFIFFFNHIVLIRWVHNNDIHRYEYVSVCPLPCISSVMLLHSRLNVKYSL